MLIAAAAAATHKHLARSLQDVAAAAVAAAGGLVRGSSRHCLLIKKAELDGWAVMRIAVPMRISMIQKIRHKFRLQIGRQIWFRHGHICGCSCCDCSLHRQRFSPTALAGSNSHCTADSDRRRRRRRGRIQIPTLHTVKQRIVGCVIMELFCTSIICCCGSQIALGYDTAR